MGGTGLQELNKDNFHSFLEEAGETLTVVDFFTDWHALAHMQYAVLAVQ